jgi:hypothetical protein
LPKVFLIPWAFAGFSLYGKDRFHLVVYRQPAEDSGAEGDAMRFDWLRAEFKSWFHNPEGWL